MKKILKEVSVWSIPLILILIILFSFNVIKSDFRLAHQSHMVWKAPHNWSIDYFFVPTKKFFVKLFNDGSIGLPSIKMYIDHSAEQKLLSNTPSSTKDWQDAKIIFEHGDDLKNIKFRYRGDNPENWLFEKKSIRIRFKKNEMRKRQRYFEYWPLELHLLSSTNLARRSGVNVSNIRLVELFINEASDGVFIEFERLDENFLRRNKFMPVNLYKGENYNTETKIGLDRNLYNNSGLWKKNAIFNQNKLTDKSDLENFLISLKQATQSAEKFKEFMSYIDMDTWAKYCAYLIVAQNQHHSPWHNNRLIIDPWSGFATPVVNDAAMATNIETDLLILDYSTNDLIKILNQNSLFIDNKYKWINHFVKEKKIINEEIDFLNLNQDKIINSIKRDPQISYKNFTIDLKNHKDNLTNINKYLLRKINLNPAATWKKSDKKFSITLNDEIPASNIRIFFNEKLPAWIFVDENYNGIDDPGEIKYYSQNKNFIDVKADFYANRLIYSLSKKFINSNVYASSTKFDFISENGSLPYKIQIENKFSKKIIEIEENEIEGSQTAVLNKVLHYDELNKDNKDYYVLSNTINVEKDLVFNQPVKILPGTTFLMNEGANIIFKHKVLAHGSSSKKIKFIQNSKNKYWGSVSLIGKLTSGSEINNVEFNGGSGGNYKQYFFSSMFSIHNSKNVKIENASFLNNSFFDDMFHIVYSDTILLNNTNFVDAFGDALDIDVSKNVTISNSSFINPKNDAIDFMESTAIVNNVYIDGSKDKGISVGEASIVELSNNKFINNSIAIAIKDASKADVKNSHFSQNKETISAYKKNWQYGSGGFVKIKDSTFTGDTIKFISLDKSMIEIIASKINGKKILEGQNIYIK